MLSQQQINTFRSLDGDIVMPAGTSALEQWYSNVRDTKIDELTIEDLATACRQNIFVEEIVPICLLKLAINPLMGELYNGEMVASLKAVSQEYWQIHPEERNLFLRLAADAYTAEGSSFLNISDSDLGAFS